MRDRSARALGAAVLLPWLLATACGEQGDDYCAEVSEHQAALSDVAASGEPGSFLDALDIYRRLRAEAPPDLSDEWSQVVGRLTALRDALDEAGVDPAAYDPEDPPPGLTQQQRTAIEAAARDLGSPGTAEAMAGLEQQALDVCGTPLSR